MRPVVAIHLGHLSIGGLAVVLLRRLIGSYAMVSVYLRGSQRHVCGRSYLGSARKEKSFPHWVIAGHTLSEKLNEYFDGLELERGIYECSSNVMIAPLTGVVLRYRV